MSQNLPDAQIETPNPADDSALDPAAAPPVDASTPDANPPPQGDNKPQQTPWYHRRIREEAERRRQAEERLSALEAQIGQQGFTETGDGQQPAPQDFNRLIEQRAAQIAEERRIKKAASRVYSDGVKSFPDYPAAINNLTNTMGEAVSRPEFLETVFDLPNSAAVLHHLGTDLDAAHEILSLPPLKMARKLERLAETLAAGPQPTRNALNANAPPEPIRPVGSSGSSAGRDPTKMSVKEYADWRAEQRAKTGR